MSNYYNGFNDTLYGVYRTRTFADVYTTAAEFAADYKSCGIPTKVTEENINTLYYLLYSKYGNSSVAASDENRFKYQLFSTIFQYGPQWQVELGVQDQLAAMDLDPKVLQDSILEGNTTVNNQSYNPSTAPTTDTLDELTTINSQYTTKGKRGKLEAYAALVSLLKSDVTEKFLRHFDSLFIKFVGPSAPLYYESDN